MRQLVRKRLESHEKDCFMTFEMVQKLLPRAVRLQQAFADLLKQFRVTSAEYDNALKEQDGNR